MRRKLFAPFLSPLLNLSLALCLAVSTVCASAAPAQAADVEKSKQAELADVLTYVRLFGYRDMLGMGVERQLAELADYYRTQRPDISADVLETIFQELRGELAGSVDESEREMAQVLQRHLTREDVAFLVGIGSDPRMQRVVKLQPTIAKELEPINERLADQMVARALPRIEQRLRAMPQGEKQPL